MPFPWCFIDSITAPELTAPELREVASWAGLAWEVDSVTLLVLVKTRLESLRRVWVRFREASARAGFSTELGSTMRLGPGCCRCWGELGAEKEGDGTGWTVSGSVRATVLLSKEMCFLRV